MKSQCFSGLKLAVIFFLCIVEVVQINGQSAYKIDNGIELDVNDAQNNIPHRIRVSFIDKKIVRISATPNDHLPKQSSLVVENTSVVKDVPIEIEETNDLVLLKSAELTVEVNKLKGTVRFIDSDGKLLLEETSIESKLFVANPIGDDLFATQQIFDLQDDDEAFYGLGQQQHGYVNYRGKNVELAQHNIVAVVPFLYSSKNYGILWDNYSITKFGDPSPYKQLSSFNLKNKKGKKGALTLTYYKNDKQVDQKEVRDIDFQYLEEEGYESLRPVSEVDKMVFEGAISSNNSGLHKFLLYGSSYFKLWLNDELIFDKWRQNWNPWSNPFELDMEANQYYDMRLEWEPNAGYMGITYQDPSPEKFEDKLVLSSEAGNGIDYYFIKGNDADDVIGGYRDLTGKAPMLPKSVFGYWQSRERYKTQDELLGAVSQYRNSQIPLDNIVLDWSYWPENAWGSHEFDETRFSDPVGMNKTLHEKWNTNIMISVWPKFYNGIEHYNEMDKKGYLFKNNIDHKRVDWIAKGYENTFYDPFNGGARSLFWEQIDEHLFEKDFDFWWLDATEPDMHSNLSIDARKENMKQTHLGPGAQFFNAYSLMNAKGVFEGQIASDPNKRVFILTRSGFAGQQRYGSVTWSGDIVSRWSDFKDQIAAGVNFSISGLPYWTMDIGGFAVEDRYAKDELRVGETLDEWRELNTRWFQFGAFCPLFRSHGQYPFREIYNLAPEGHPAYESMVYYDKLRYKLMPYIYSLAGQVYWEDYTLMRGLVMDFPDDLRARNIADQYMFGPDLLVNPVMENKARDRMVYLPKGQKWYDLYTGISYEGGQEIKANAPLSKMPVYVKEGAIISKGLDIQHTGESSLENLTLYVYDGSDGDFELYDDNGKDYSYELGDYIKIPLHYYNETKELHIGAVLGRMFDSSQSFKFSIILIDQKNEIGFDSKEVKSIEVDYKGKALSIKL